MDAALAADVGTDAAVWRALPALRSRAGMHIAFGAKVNADGRAMRILYINGGLTQSLSGLHVSSGAGLGGKCLALGRPTQVRDYLLAKGITHHYDEAVAPERLCTMAALPVRVAGASRYVVYVGNRSEIELGDRWIDRLAPLLAELERQTTVVEEVQRRLRHITEASRDERPGLSIGELREIACELAALAGDTPDGTLKARLQALHDRVAAGQPDQRRPPPQTPLSPREIAVLERVAAGCSNADAADSLGLLPNTVKSYLKSAMRKLHATNRVQAIVAARAAGIIR